MSNSDQKRAWGFIVIGLLALAPAGVEFIGSPTDRPGIRFGSQPSASGQGKRR
jgi:hypothetical protein